MLGAVIPVIGPVILVAMLGFLWARSGQAFQHDFVRRLVMWVAAPCLIVGSLSDVRLPADTFNTLLVAALLLLGISAALAYLLCLVSRLSVRDFVPPLTFGNFGNMGLPLCLFAFGSEGLVLALGIFLVTTVVHFSLGVAVLSGRAPGRSLLQTPIVYAGAIGVLLIYFDWQVPATLGNTLNLLGGMAIPLMLITLGVSLASLRLSDAGPALGLGLARLLIGLVAGLATVELLALEGLLRGVVLLQAATPAAVFNYLLALQFQRQPQRVAGMVMASTIMSFVSIPLLLIVLI